MIDNASDRHRHDESRRGSDDKRHECQHQAAAIAQHQRQQGSQWSEIAGARAGGSGTPADWARFQAAVKNAQADGKAQLVAAKAKAQAAGQPFVMPPDRITMIKAIAAGTPASALLPQGITPESYFATSTLAFNTYRTVEQQTADQATASAQQIASDAKTNAIVNSAAVLAGVLMAFLVAGLMARGMSHGMRRLRNAAFDVAEQRLPALVDQLSRTDPGRVDTRVLPIPITSNDEIGEVARAFDQVHREAVRLASEQALLRGNVNAIFTNLSMRNQGLIQRQLELITDLEGNEGDPDQLENLFKLDHLATRMRRNGENLLVLAGQEPGRRWNEPVPLVDVLRAAASEVESYERIEITGVPETDIHGGVVTELTVKAGQKCTAIRRVIVPSALRDDVVTAIGERLDSKVVLGDPRADGVTMGPLVSGQQRDEVLRQLRRLVDAGGRIVYGDLDDPLVRRADGTEAADPSGAFVAPVLLAFDDPWTDAVHTIEAFGPAASVLGYDTTQEAIDLVAAGRGSLVTSVASHDATEVAELVTGIAPYNGRVLVLDRDDARTSTGHGSPVPHLVHGGPGRAAPAMSVAAA